MSSGRPAARLELTTSLSDATGTSTLPPQNPRRWCAPPTPRECLPAPAMGDAVASLRVRFGEHDP